MSADKKRFVGTNLVFSLFLCLFGGAIDGFTFFFKGGTFTIIQTGNLVRSIYSFIIGQNGPGIYSLIVLLTFLIFLGVNYLLIKFFESKNINHKLVTLIAALILFIPSVIFPFDVSYGNTIITTNEADYLSFGTIFSGVCIAIIGAMIATSFRNVHLTETYVLAYNAGFMTGNMRSMMINLARYFRTKNKIKLYDALWYFIMVFNFGLSIAIIVILGTYAQAPWGFYSSVIILYIFLLIQISIISFQDTISRKVTKKYQEYELKENNK